MMEEMNTPVGCPDDGMCYLAICYATGLKLKCLQGLGGHRNEQSRPDGGFGKQAVLIPPKRGIWSWALANCRPSSLVLPGLQIDSICFRNSYFTLSISLTFTFLGDSCSVYSNCTRGKAVLPTPPRPSLRNCFVFLLYHDSKMWFTRSYFW